jgi:hypothetical protein
MYAPRIVNIVSVVAWFKLAIRSHGVFAQRLVQCRDGLR